MIFKEKDETDQHWNCFKGKQGSHWETEWNTLWISPNAWIPFWTELHLLGEPAKRGIQCIIWQRQVSVTVVDVSRCCLVMLCCCGCWGTVIRWFAITENDVTTQSQWEHLLTTSCRCKHCTFFRHWVVRFQSLISDREGVRCHPKKVRGVRWRGGGAIKKGFNHKWNGNVSVTWQILSQWIGNVSITLQI